MHSINKWSFPVSESKEKISAEINEYVCEESDSHGGLYSPIKWIDYNAGTREQAEAYIDRIDTGSYGQYAVKFTEPKETKKIADLQTKRTEAYKKYSVANDELHCEKVTSEFIGCKECGSKLARKHLRSNFCPLCRADLRSPTELKRIKSLKDAVDKADKALRVAEEEQAKKGGNEKWLVKFEFHC